MNRLYLTYNERSSKREYYSYAVLKNNPVYVSLNANEIEGYLYKILSSEIAKIKEISASLMEITMETGEMIIIDNVKVFKSLDKFDQYIREFQKRIKAYREAENIRDYKERLPKRYIPKVNRAKSRARNKLLISGVSLALVAILASNYLNTEIKKEQSNADFNDYGFAFVEDTTKTKYEKPNIGSNALPDVQDKNGSNIEIPFESRLESDKLAATIDYCGEIIEYYSTRYGLPYLLNCAQITQERPSIIDGQCKNICQVESSHIGEMFHIPVYDENGFTGTYDDFVVTADMLNTLEGNIKAGLAYDRKSVDKYDNLLLGYFLYNHGPNSLNKACEYYGIDIEEYKKPENVLKARDLIVSYYKEVKPDGYGDPNYLENILSYIDLEDRSDITLEYYVGNDLETLTITNTNLIDKSAIEDYNNDLSRG